MNDRDLLARLEVAANAADTEANRLRGLATTLDEAAVRIEGLIGQRPPGPPSPDPPPPDTTPEGGAIVWPGTGSGIKKVLSAGTWRIPVNAKIPARSKAEWRAAAETENLVARVGPRHHQLYCRVNKRGLLGWQEGWKDPSKEPSWQHIDPRVPDGAPPPTVREVTYEFEVKLEEAAALHVGPDDRPVHDGVLDLKGWHITVTPERIK